MNIIEFFKNIINNAINKFQQEVMNPAQEELNFLEASNEENDILDSINQFVGEKINDLKENETEIGFFEELKEKFVGSQDLEELSQNFLDSKENADTDQMERLSKKIVEINEEKEPQRYKEMSEEEMLNFRLAEGLAAIDTENYRQTLSEEDQAKLDDAIYKNSIGNETKEPLFKIYEAIQIAAREEYLNNDFNTNERLLTNELSKMYNPDNLRGNGKYEKYTAIDERMSQVEKKMSLIDEGKSYKELVEEFKEISSNGYDDKRSADRTFKNQGTKALDDQPDYYSACSKLNKVGAEYRQDVKKQDITKATEYMKMQNYEDQFYANVPEDLFIDLEDQKVPGHEHNFYKE